MRSGKHSIAYHWCSSSNPSKPSFDRDSYGTLAVHSSMGAEREKPLMTSHVDRPHIGCIFVVRMHYTFIFTSCTDPPTLCLRTYDRTIPCDTRRILIPLHHPFLASSATHKLLYKPSGLLSAPTWTFARG